LRNFGIGNKKGVAAEELQGAGTRSVTAIVELNTCCAAQ
jgi:hypothetical protein